MANCLINANFYVNCGIVVRKEVDRIVFENPGYIRTGKEQMRLGGVSDPRNKSLMKMFNLINIGERAGSGVPNIYKIWKEENYLDPVIEERFDPDRTILYLPFVKKQATKASDKKQATKNKQQKTNDNEQKLREYLALHKNSNIQDLADCIGLSTSRTRAILSEMIDVIPDGERKNRTYRLK